MTTVLLAVALSAGAPGKVNASLSGWWVVAQTNTKAPTAYDQPGAMWQFSAGDVLRVDPVSGTQDQQSLRRTTAQSASIRLVSAAGADVRTATIEGGQVQLRWGSGSLTLRPATPTETQTYNALITPKKAAQ